MKINRSTVDKEANLSVGILRNHEDVVLAIKSASSLGNSGIVGTLEPNDAARSYERKGKKLKLEVREQARLQTKHYDNAKRE